MNFYIVGKQQSTINYLRDIIERDFNNTIVGTTSDPQEAFYDVMRLSVDIMFIDLNLNRKNGIELIQQIQQNHHYPHFILLSSQPTDEEITKAYENGIDFLIRKPINKAEAKSIVKMAAQNIKMSNRIIKVLDLVSGAETNANTIIVSNKTKKKENSYAILRFLGINGGV
ncbi:response regulator [Lactobacillus sp. PSON]|uniref:response regulator n=1 Tax=Lactobacillus sp. PSON TaxID=3455454 RepID=UPI00404335F8